MGSVALTVLSVAIGLFFVLVGTIKLSPLISEDVHKEMRKGFTKFVKVFPLASFTGWKPSAQLYRQIVGITEVICGLLLAFVPGSLKQFASIVLLIIMGGAIHAHYMVGDPVSKMIMALVFGLLLTARLFLQSKQQTREKLH